MRFLLTVGGKNIVVEARFGMLSLSAALTYSATEIWQEQRNGTFKLVKSHDHARNGELKSKDEALLWVLAAEPHDDSIRRKIRSPMFAPTGSSGPR